MPASPTYFWDVCNSKNSGCGGVNLGGHGDPSSPNGYRQDYSVPLARGTIVQAPVSGVVLPTHSEGYMSLFGRQDWGGEVDILTQLDTLDSKRPVVVTLLHFDALDSNLRPGSLVSYGDPLGWSGGQTSGGNWPSSPKDSTGPHMGVAVRPFATWHNFWNPTGLMQSVEAGGNPSKTPSADTMNAMGIKTSPYTPSGQAGGYTNPLTQLGNPLDALTGIGNFFQAVGSFDFGRIVKIVIGSLLLGLALIATIFGPALPDIAAAGVTAAGVPEAAGPVATTLHGKRGAIRAGVRAAGAVRGQRVLKEREESARRQTARDIAADILRGRREAAARGRETRRENLRRTARGELPMTPAQARTYHAGQRQPQHVAEPPRERARAQRARERAEREAKEVRLPGSKEVIGYYEGGKLMQTPTPSTPAPPIESIRARRAREKAERAPAKKLRAERLKAERSAFDKSLERFRRGEEP